ncbi:4Fe-4S dicluster domain-containing protein [bacterium]|nr:4Fe-4S dicluster domain-containing protein [candidate division CSSED10-310 bacterium]
MKRLYVNPEPCTGCFNCMAVCEQRRTGGMAPGRAVIQVGLAPFSGRHEFTWCRQCREATCAAACGQGAIARNELTGAWQIEQTRCRRCGSCITACPFNAMRWDDDLGPLKCDLCGGAPLCVEACHFGVLQYCESASRPPRGIPNEDLDPALGWGE